MIHISIWSIQLPYIVYRYIDIYLYTSYQSIYSYSIFFDTQHLFFVKKRIGRFCLESFGQILWLEGYGLVNLPLPNGPHQIYGFNKASNDVFFFSTVFEWFFFGTKFILNLDHLEIYEISFRWLCSIQKHKKNKSSTPPNCTTCFWCCSNSVKDKTNNINKIIWHLMWMMTFLLTWVVPCFFHIHTHKFHLFPSKSLFGPIKSMVAGFTYSMVVAVEWDIDINQYHHGSGPQAKNLSWKVMVTETRGEIKICGTRIAAGEVELWCFFFFFTEKTRRSKNLVCPKEFSFESSLSSTKNMVLKVKLILSWHWIM